MRFQITTDYAIRVLHYLGKRPNDLPTAEEIAKETSITYPYLIRVANHLKKAGLIETERGRYGGYRLAVELSEITFLDVVEAMEGEFSLSRREESGHFDGPEGENCPACRAIDGLEDRMRKYLGSVYIGPRD